MKKHRLVVVSVFLLFLFCSLLVRFYQIQIIEGDKWTKVALSQHQYVTSEPFKRGSFYSNTSLRPSHREDEQPFVVDVIKFHLFIDPDSIPSPIKEKMANELASILDVDVQKISPEFSRKSRSRKIAEFLDREERQGIENWWKQFSSQEKLVRNAIYFTSDYQRSYPFGSMLGTILHTVQKERDPKTGQCIPTGGLELLLSSYLEGKKGKRLMVSSPRRPLDMGKVLEEPEDGADIFLTVNHYIQAVAESELAKGVKEVNALGGWAVMMDPSNGEILALAQTPTFDPTNYSLYYNDPELLDATRVRAVTECFEPGSIFKPITAALCLHANEECERSIFSADEKIATASGAFPGRSKPLKDGRVHKYLNLDLAMQKSSNIYMGRIVQRTISALGDAWYRQSLVDLFGFGQKMNIELPGESPGLLPTPGKLHPNGKPEWSVPTPYSLSIGYNILTNSIQLVRAYGILANGGYAVQPHLVRKIVKALPDGSKQVLVDNTGYKATKRVLSDATCNAVKRAMKFNTKEGGTSKRADVFGYTEAGKSGTSEKMIDGTYSKVNNTSSFIGFVPADNPRFVLLVTLDDPERKFIPGVGKQQHGGTCAAPIFREISAKVLQYLGVPPDDPFGYSYGDPRRDLSRADWSKEVKKLKELYEEWNH